MTVQDLAGMVAGLIVDEIPPFKPYPLVWSALADALDELGHGVAAHKLRAGFIGRLRARRPATCDYVPGCTNDAAVLVVNSNGVVSGCCSSHYPVFTRPRNEIRACLNCGAHDGMIRVPDQEVPLHPYG